MQGGCDVWSPARLSTNHISCPISGPLLVPLSLGDKHQPFLRQCETGLVTRKPIMVHCTPDAVQIPCDTTRSIIRCQTIRFRARDREFGVQSTKTGVRITIHNWNGWKLYGLPFKFCQNEIIRSYNLPLDCQDKDKRTWHRVNSECGHIISGENASWTSNTINRLLAIPVLSPLFQGEQDVACTRSKMACV